MSILADLVASRASRLHVRTNPEEFADKGQPWSTPDDWNREVLLAGNPDATTGGRQSALDYVRPASGPGRHERLAFVEPKHSPPIGEHSLRLRFEREVLNSMLTLIEVPSRTLQTAATPSERERFITINCHLHKAPDDNPATPWDRLDCAKMARDHKAFVEAEREAMRIAREKRPHHRDMWPVV